MHIHDVVNWSQLNDDQLSFYRAIGVDMVQLDLRTGGKTEAEQIVREGRDSTELFEKAREKVESHGLKLHTVFMSAWDEITLATTDRDEKLDIWVRMTECLGKAGIPTLGWNFKPKGNFRTTADIGRGGVSYSTFDYAEFDQNRPEPHDPPVSESQMWEHMETFLQVAVPAAEKAGVRMALHPDDPPIPEPLGGVAQICSTLEQFRRIFDTIPSDNHGMLFCQGCMTELLGPERIYDAIAEMASKNKVVWVHFRNVRGQLPRFTEVFHDEGEVDMRRAMEVYRDNGFNGPYGMDHTPRFPQEQAGWAGKAYANGYIRALIQTVYG
ncbi:MAG: mannonate dehydratase [Verrucomicrobia bacterium]|nr:mannonate dehydratase [Verrucomicrobiota bacterium]